MKLLIEAMRRAPVLSSRPFERAVVGLCRSPVARMVRAAESRKLRGLRKVERILVISDTNIGDSVLLKTALPVFARRLPHVRIDFAYHHKVVELVDPDPVITRSIALPGGGPAGAEIAAGKLRAETKGKSYDLVLNFCPFIPVPRVGHPEAAVLAPASLAGNVLRACGEGELASLLHHVVEFVEGVVDELPGAHPRAAENGESIRPVVFLSREHRRAARSFVEGQSWTTRDTLVFVNPDCSNDSTLVDAGVFAHICHSLSRSPQIDGIVLGRGYTYPGIETEIIARLPDEPNTKIAVVSSDLNLGDFAALCDLCEVYVGGDTGPLHIAAAHKAPANPGQPQRNRTVVVGLFKATEPRIYGYSTHRADMLDTAQAAESTVFEGRPDCKNLTCSLQRLTATCPAIVCGEMLNPSTITDYVVGSVERKVFLDSSEPGNSRPRKTGSTNSIS